MNAPTPRITLQPRVPETPQLVNILHSPKRIRVKFAGQAIADSRKVLVLRSNHFLPVYFFPRSDISDALLSASEARGQHALGDVTSYFDLQLGDRRVAAAAWQFGAERQSLLAPLDGYVAFDWKKVDQWFEEDEEVFVHARDPYARIDILHSASHVQVRLAGEVIADTHRPVLLFETHLPTRFYIPLQDIRQDRLVASDTQTRCPYKGVASYWSFRLPDGSIREDIAWYYPDPIAEAAKIKNLVAFYPNAVDEIRLDGVRVAP